jgi:ADP-ribosylglycohydrolase
MRAAPFGAFYRYDPKLAGNMAVLDAGISHPTTEAREGSRAVAVAVALLCYGVGKTSMLPRVLEQVQASKVRSVLANLQCPESSVSPHVVETVNAAFFAFLNTANFSDAVEMAIRFGGDTDSVASITGALAGAHYGYMSLPKDLLGQLEGADEIHDLNLGLLE